MDLRRFIPRRRTPALIFAISALVATVVAGLAIHHFASGGEHQQPSAQARSDARRVAASVEAALVARSAAGRPATRSIIERAVRSGLAAAATGATARVEVVGPRGLDVSATSGAPASGPVVSYSLPVAFFGSDPRDSARVIASVPEQAAIGGSGGLGLGTALIIFLGALWLGLVVLASKAAAGVRGELVRREEEARRDPLTGLPNRAHFHDLVHRAIVASGRRGKVTLMLMDLNRFKEINDTLGHHTGDRVLQQLAQRLRNVLRDSETIARLGGDEFGILLPNVGDRHEVTAVATRILKALEEPFVAAGLALDVDASIGIALYPDHGDRVAKLLRAADVAMYVGKESLSGYTFFNEGSDPGDGGRRLVLVGELRSALEHNQLVLYYQPKVQLSTGKVTGVEALVRWQHDRGGLLAPDEFIPLLEQSSLLRRFTLYIVQAALRDCSAWRAQGFDLKVAVNLSMRNLLDSQLPADLRGLVHKTPDIRSDALELEITESMIMSDPERIFRVCMALREIGFELTVDDFGTGYSSLAYLQRLPVTSLKIDKSFVAAMNDGHTDSEMIVRSTLDMAQNMGLAVVAEGVETAETFHKLATLGCDQAQGFYISRPLPHEELLAWLKSGHELRPQPLLELVDRTSLASAG